MAHESIDEQTALQLTDYIASHRTPSDIILKRDREIRQVMIWANKQRKWDVLIRIAHLVTKHFIRADVLQEQTGKDDLPKVTANKLWLQGIEFSLVGLTASLHANDSYHERLFLDDLAHLSQNLGNYETARQYFESQLLIDGSPEWIAQRLYLLGHEAHQVQNFAVARKCYQKSVDIYQSMGNQYAMANIMAFMAVNEEEDGNLDLMQQYIEQSENLRKQVTSIKSKQ